MGSRGHHRGIVVIGAGIAGASVAAELAAAGQDVLLLERESAPGYHTTGRSAALYTPSYGPPVIRALTRASAAAFNAPPSAERPYPLLRPRDVLFVANAGQGASLEAAAADLPVTRISAAEARAMLPLLREDYLAGALHDAGSADIDVEALHRQFLRALTAHRGELRLKAEVTGITRAGKGWRIETPQGEITAEMLVNASGAWADDIARMAGVAPVGLVPKRRTAMLVAPPAGQNVDDWPMVVDIDETFYLRPDAGKLLLSPADETPSEPCDAQPDEWDVALCIDRVQQAVDLPVRRIDHKWAGLRSFVADKAPVVGPAPDAAGFVWVAGQGGYGIQTAPALGRTAAALALGQPIPQDIADHGVRAEALAPRRQALAA
ncbi:NAD(P)/FAD-dependent oxidoreductase [Pararhodobacter aggregans]|uniref:FAD-dependent oxidoreductase n=1 Tax=Pararhodobacter aggregans TaxID=404875 RepID=A0A2T7UTP1_9RHOB|nr:FAD-binding oxidoreductase [Pararhodobacter aggregans]PTX02717.1 D-arginine dehydrogenase [Pararhodobacter aggregans]PVE47949.1 FAD-dependent oxidoreductase [Pararhodobacter aggregans]